MARAMQAAALPTALLTTGSWCPAEKLGSDEGLEMARAMQAIARRDWVRVLAAQAEAHSTGRPALAFLSGAPVPVDAGSVPGRAWAMRGLGDKLEYMFLQYAAAVVSVVVRAMKGDGGIGCSCSWLGLSPGSSPLAWLEGCLGECAACACAWALAWHCLFPPPAG
jgi:hypothetical protein